MTMLKQQAREIFRRVLKASSLTSQLDRMVSIQDGALCVAELRFPLNAYERAIVVAVGKAAAPMSEHCVELLRPHLAIDGLVVGNEPEEPIAELSYVPGSHPLPDDCSCTAAECALTLARKADEKTLVLWLVSGGASAMMETPLDERISTKDIREFYQSLVHSGLSIGEMNALRKHLSAVKGGRLAVAAQRAATQLTLLVSDVPEGMLDVIGSGPTLPDTSTVAECRELLAAFSQPVPASVSRWFANEHSPETPKVGDAAFARCENVTLLSSATLCEHAAEAVREFGFEPVIDNTCDEWGYVDAASYLLDRLGDLRGPGKRIALISAGEISVPVTGSSGQGGRNQHFALHMAKLIQNDKNVVVMSAGSDGIDGNSPAAGAVVDEETWKRAAEPEKSLAGFDSGSVFAALGDAIVTGKTGNNLRDLRVLLAVD